MAMYFSSLRPRRDCAKSQSQSLLRQFGLLVSLTALSILAACGGGGGGETPPVTQPPVTPPTALGVVDATQNCDIKVQGNSCNGTARIAGLANVSNPTLVVGEGATASIIPVTGNGEVMLPLSGPGERKVVLKDGSGKVLDDTKKVASLCVAGASWDGLACSVAVPPTAYYYDRVNILITGEVVANTGNGTLGVAYPQIIVGNSVKPVKNETGFQVGLCSLSSMKLPSGLPAAWCTKPSNGNVRALFPINPTPETADFRGVLMPEYTGAIPAEMVYYAGPYGVFGNSPYAAFGVSVTGMFIDVPGVGVYYYLDNNKTHLRLTRDGFATNEVIRTGPDNTLLMTYSNPAPVTN